MVVCSLVSLVRNSAASPLQCSRSRRPEAHAKSSDAAWIHRPKFLTAMTAHRKVAYDHKSLTIISTVLSIHGHPPHEELLSSPDIPITYRISSLQVSSHTLGFPDAVASDPLNLPIFRQKAPEALDFPQITPIDLLHFKPFTSFTSATLATL